MNKLYPMKALTTDINVLTSAKMLQLRSNIKR